MSRWAAGQTSVRATGRLSTAVRLAGVGHPGERLGQVKDLSGPDDLLSLGEQLLEDGSPHLRLEKVRRDGLFPDLLCRLIVEHVLLPTARSRPGDGAEVAIGPDNWRHCARP